MSNKMLIGIVVAIIVIIIILLCIVFNAYKDDGERYTQTTPGMITVEQKEEAEKTYANLIDEANKINSKYKASNYNEDYILLKEEERLKIDSVIDEVLEFFNSKNVDAIYSKHLANDYILTRFPDKEELQKYMDSNFSEEATYSVNSYEVSGSTLLIPIIETKFGSSMEFGDVKIKDFLSSEYIIYFDNVQEIIKVTNTYRKDDFNILINYGLDFLDHCSFILKIENKTNKNLEFDFENTYLREKSGKVYSNLALLGDPVVSVPAKEKVIYEAKFDRFKVYPDSLIFNIKYGDKTIKDDRLYINYNSEDSER